MCTVYFCQSCQRYRDTKTSPIHQHEDGQCCDDCFFGRTKEKVWDKFVKQCDETAEQCDENSVEIFELDKRVKKLERK